MSKKRKDIQVSSLDELLVRLNGEGELFGQSLGDPTRPVFGTMLFLASCELEMRFGNFRAYVFQDISHRGYVIALAHGDISSAKELYTRIHSSCVTSETLRGCDCDCVQQLEGALKRIGEKGSGILFYFMQEGRGVGYVAKSRDRMLVQASEDQLSTFAAYRSMGLAKDYRRYDSISSICTLLGIDAEFVVMTNNPDKVTALREQGITVARTETIEYDPGPYNLAYLSSKAESGHTLSKAREAYTASALPPEPVVPFAPYVLPEVQRFVHVSTYFLPMKPIDDEVLLTSENMEKIFGSVSIDSCIEEHNDYLLSGRKVAGDAT